jgi:hypothetical protein
MTSLSAIVSAGVGVVSRTVSNPVPPVQLDPICVVFWLAMATFEKEGAKPSILKGRFTYDPPGPDQWSVRRAKGVGREDLGHLKEPLKQARLQWAAERNEQLIQAAKEAIEGILLISRSYKAENTIDTTEGCLEGYQGILQDIIAGKGGSSALEVTQQQEKYLWNDRLIVAANLLKTKDKKALAVFLESSQERFTEIKKH